MMLDANWVKPLASYSTTRTHITSLAQPSLSILYNQTMAMGRGAAHQIGLASPKRVGEGEGGVLLRGVVCLAANTKPQGHTPATGTPPSYTCVNA